MASRDDFRRAFTGSSGQMAVMAELLLRHCNAAVPHVDIGTDVFAFRDDRVDVARIQVKSAIGQRYKRGTGFSARFGIPMKQLERTDVPRLYYALAVRLEGVWVTFLVISRKRLQEMWNAGCGSENMRSGDLELHIQFRPRDSVSGEKWTATCGNKDQFQLTEYLDAWESLPPLEPTTDDAPSD